MMRVITAAPHDERELPLAVRFSRNGGLPRYKSDRCAASHADNWRSLANLGVREADAV